MHHKGADDGVHSPLGPGDSNVPGYAESHEDDPLILQDPTTAEKRLLRKLDRRILPITCLLYLFAYLDRSNLGNARLQGLPEDVLGGDPSGVLFDWLVAAFYITCMSSLTPCSIFSKYYNPRIWLACSAILWGICSTSMATASGFGHLLVARLGLGVFEAAFAPSIILYFSFYYTKAEYGIRIASWFGFAAVAGAFGGLLAYGIQNIKISIPSWRLLFLVEGVPSVLLGVLCLFILPGRPESTSFLTHAERNLAIERMNRGTSGDVGAVVNRSHVIAAFWDWRVYAAGITNFGLNCALGSLSAFLPTIIETLGHSPASSQLLTIPPYAVACLVLISSSYASDRIQSRGFIIVSGCSMGGIGYMILLGASHEHVHVRYLATFCIAAGTYTSLGLMMAWFAHNLGSETKRATGIPLFGTIGQAGSILGSHLYPLTDGPAYSRGFGVSGALMFLAALSALTLSISYRMENARRNAAYGEPDRDAPVDTSELADKAPGFRYLP
ncbi:major facilitator superfamily domain-containing protein [Chiua virens]|nr:major facilitator superfamily domain-containing protein [Chiua virens]